ncbi:P-selectin-like [Amblyraja radiata]|uniref:P-selectin-like n=1 Tax=Amblyraja radiata TaxID=386614 RepID=UPI001402F24B|nr:P-selectin-like [Amblyraja radiata]
MWKNITIILFISGYPYISESVTYKFQKTAKSFEESKGYCTTEFDGLAHIYNAEQQRALSRVVDGSAWIGVSKCGENWCNTGSNRMMSYTNWAAGEPNNHRSRINGEEDCVEMLSSHKWNYENCSYKKYFVCQKLRCSATTCNRRGACSELVNYFKCNCERGYYGNKCENVKICPHFVKPSNSEVKCEGLHGENYFQSVCTLTCDQGFILKGNNSITCQAFGRWTTYNTVCQALGAVNHHKLIRFIITVGAGAVILSIISVIIWWRWRSRREQANSTNDPSSPAPQAMSICPSSKLYCEM